MIMDTSLPLRVMRELDQIAELRGYLRMAVSDNGTELTLECYSGLAAAARYGTAPSLNGLTPRNSELPRYWA